LIEYEPAGEPCTAESVNQRGAKHLGFEVDDVDAFYADLPDDVETLSEPQTTPTGARYCSSATRGQPNRDNNALNRNGSRA